MIQIQELLVLMQNQTQIRICESENLSLARAVYSAQITVQATQGEISDNSLISLKTVASDVHTKTLKSPWFGPSDSHETWSTYLSHA